MNNNQTAGNELLAEECRQAIAALERGREEPPLGLSQEADVAERAIVQARDQLITRLRQDPQANDALRWREALGRMNAALSLLAGLEYPMGGVPRQSIDATIGLLSEALSRVTSG